MTLFQSASLAAFSFRPVDFARLFCGTNVLRGAVYTPSKECLASFARPRAIMQPRSFIVAHLTSAISRTFAVLRFRLCSQHLLLHYNERIHWKVLPSLDPVTLLPWQQPMHNDLHLSCEAGRFFHGQISLASSETCE